MANMQGKSLSIVTIFYLGINTLGHIMAQQRVSLGFPTLSYTRTQTFTTGQHTAPLGLSGEYDILLSQGLAFSSQLVLNMDSSTIVFLGGGGGVKWFIYGGSNVRYEDPYLITKAVPKFHLFVVGGLSARSFDFTQIEKEAQQSGTGVKFADPKGATTGFFLGPLIAVGAEMPVFGFNIGGRFQLFNSFASETSPGISGQELWLYSVFNL